MARSKGRTHGRIYLSVWDDDDFRQLPAASQWAYFMLLTQRRLSWAGVLDYVPERFDGHAADATARSVSKAVGVLEARKFVVIDLRTCELLIRSYVRHDGILDSPNVTIAMCRAYRQIVSATVRDALTTELSRAYAEQPTLPGWAALAPEHPTLWASVSGNPSPN